MMQKTLISTIVVAVLVISIVATTATVLADDNKKMVPSEFREEIVKIKKPSMDELLEVNEGHFNFLRKNLGEKGEELVNQAITN
ncbi:MAG: hypothetical protein PHD13_00575 [Methanocellales archaeon]|nr:hypothetical protein [Methanocellales archaeon]MDD3291449.1 hypothetical protein [Methanocellales archaeon]MDD5234661.1 hypothetical protein [Methanocellales archaeon]MDD5484986.1 hypothetical protein [Methanocellales archaeon]